MLGSTVIHGVEIGEAFYTASKIKDGDAASWQAEWFKMARLAETRGERALAGGGVPQAAMHDPRLKAIAMSSGVVDACPLFSTMPVVLASQKEINSWTTFHRNIVKAICWRWGVPMEKPSAPALLIVGEGEYKSQGVRRQQKVIMDGLPHPKKRLVITPTSERATNHCVMENRSLVSQVLFDWLDELFR